MSPLRRVIHAAARPGALLILEPRDLHHLLHVLRLAAGAQIEVLDGRGGSFRGTLRGPQPPQIEVTRAAATDYEPEPVTIALALLKGPRMDLAVEKLSELGIERLVPLATRRSVGRPRPERWSRIVRESARQCGRSRLLEVTEAVAPGGLPRLLPESYLGWLLDPAGEPLSIAALAGASHVVLAVGPEGGFDVEERRLLEASGMRPVRLSRSCLRAETAAIAAAAAVVACRAGARPPIA